MNAGDGRHVATKSSLMALALLAALLLGCAAMLRASPPTGLASPTNLFLTETEAALLLFAILILTVAPLSALIRVRMSRLSRISEVSFELPLAVRAAAFSSAVLGMFGFLFWTTADVLGGYNGYGSSFAEHPYLRTIYDASGLRLLGSLDHGTQASLFFALAVAGFVVLGLGNGMWTSIKDSVTLFAAPVLGGFEIALWYSAPNDMTWHVIDALWFGGVNDGGWRALDYPGSGPFIFSNWFVLMVCVLLLAARAPWLGEPSQILHRKILPGLDLAGPGRAVSSHRRVRTVKTRSRRLTRTKVMKQSKNP